MLTITEKLRNFISSIFPDFDLEFNWSIPDLPININGIPAQLTSDALIRFAQRCQVSPDSLVEKINPKLNNLGDGFLISIDYGYLNLNFTRYCPEYFKEFEKDPEILIIFPLGLTGKTDAEFVRLLSLASSQLIFANSKKKLIVFSEQSSASFLNISSALFKTVRHANDSNFPKTLIELLKDSSISSHANVTVWLSPEQANKKRVTELYREVGRINPNLQIQIPHASWLKDLDSEIVSKFSSLSQKSEILKLALLLSNNLPSSELYFDEAILPGRNNLCWYLEATSSRIKSLEISPQTKISNLKLEDLPDSLKGLFWKMILLPVARQEAIRKGEIAKFFSKMYDFLDSFNFFVNSPDLRLRLIQNRSHDYEIELIVTGWGLVNQLKSNLDEGLQ